MSCGVVLQENVMRSEIEFVGRNRVGSRLLYEDLDVPMTLQHPSRTRSGVAQLVPRPPASRVRSTALSG